MGGGPGKSAERELSETLYEVNQMKWRNESLERELRSPTRPPPSFY